VDVLTIVPVVFDLSGVGGANLGFLRVVRVMRVLRILRMRRLVNLGENEVERQVFVVFFTIVCISFCTAGLLQVRSSCASLSIHPPTRPIALQPRRVVGPPPTAAAVGEGVTWTESKIQNQSCSCQQGLLGHATLAAHPGDLSKISPAQ
jgi:hypothetical protein